MFRSPPDLRSGKKAQPVSLSADKPKVKVQRSASTSSAGCPTPPLPPPPPPPPPPTTTMSNTADPALLDACVARYFREENNFQTLVSNVILALRPVVEEAVKAALTALSREVKELREEVVGLREDLADRTDELEQYQRRDNLRIFGIKEAKGEDTDAEVVKLCREQLNIELPVNAISRSHRVGKPNTPDAEGKVRPRPIIVRFASYRDRRMVFEAKKKLKSTGFTIREDLTTRRMEVLRRAIALHGLKKTWTLDGRVLWIDGDGKKGVATRLSDLPDTPRTT